MPSTKYGSSLKRGRHKEESRKKNASEIQEGVYHHHHHHHHLAAMLLPWRTEAWKSCLEISTLCFGFCSFSRLTGMVRWRACCLLTQPLTHAETLLPHRSYTTQPPQYKWQWVGGQAGKPSESLLHLAPAISARPWPDAHRKGVPSPPTLQGGGKGW